METEDKLKEIDIKNLKCYYFDDIIKDVDIYFSDILLDKKKLYENISFYDILYNTWTGPKRSRIRFNKIHEFIRIRSSELKHLTLFDNGLFDKICNKIKYLISEKSGITDSVNHNFGKIRIKKYWKNIDISWCDNTD